MNEIKQFMTCVKLREKRISYKLVKINYKIVRKNYQTSYFLSYELIL
jgi:hypothetical protein